MKIAYGLLCIAGTLLPLSQFAPWLAANGLAVHLLLQQAFAAPIAAFAWLDVLVSAVVLVVFVLSESRRLGMRFPWLSILGLITVGVSLALPLFLLLREQHITAGRT